jgi:glycosyltransferase involved in cell wall biosynthesis
MELSLCMIVRDEEAVIGRCLNSIKDAVDEIIIVDTGSTDKTIQICSMIGATVYTYVWNDDFSAARNYAFSLATKDLIMWLDADDIVEPNEVARIIKLKNNFPQMVNVINMLYQTSFDENGIATFEFLRERMFRRSLGPKWVGAVHEVVECPGPSLDIDIKIKHNKVKEPDRNRNLRIFELQKSKGLLVSPRDRFYYARELMYNRRFQEAIDELEDFLLDEKGWKENRITACIDLYYCYLAIENPNSAVNALVSSFMYDTPRAEISCKLGDYWFEKKEYYKAIYWYETATKCDPKANKGAFVDLDCYGYIPFMQMCLSHYFAGELEKAMICNEKAAKIKPTNESVLNNRKFFTAHGFPPTEQIEVDDNDKKINTNILSTTYDAETKRKLIEKLNELNLKQQLVDKITENGLSPVHGAYTPHAKKAEETQVSQTVSEEVSPIEEIIKQSSLLQANDQQYSIQSYTPVLEDDSVYGPQGVVRGEVRSSETPVFMATYSSAPVFDEPIVSPVLASETLNVPKPLESTKPPFPLLNVTPRPEAPPAPIPQSSPPVIQVSAVPLPSLPPQSKLVPSPQAAAEVYDEQPPAEEEPPQPQHHIQGGKPLLNMTPRDPELGIRPKHISQLEKLKADLKNRGQEND